LYESHLGRRGEEDLSWVILKRETKGLLAPPMKLLTRGRCFISTSEKGDAYGDETEWRIEKTLGKGEIR